MAYPKMAEKAAEKQGTVTTKQLKGALKAGGKMAAEEILLTMVPVARIPRLMRLIAKLGPKAKRSEVADALKKGGFDKLASTTPSVSELKRVGRNAEARAKVAKGTKKAERRVARDKSILKRSKADAAKEQTLQRSTPKKQVAAQRVKEERSDHLADKYGQAPPRTKAAQKEQAEKLAAIRFKRDKRGSVRKDSPWGKVSEFHQKELVDSLKTAKKARATERKVNRLADLSDTIAKNAAKRKEALRKAAESKAGKGADAAGRAKAKRTFRTEDGYTFHELADGRVVDNLNLKNVDMDWPSVKAFKKDMGDLL